MIKVALVLAWLLLRVLPYHQKDYILILHNIEIPWYDKNHITYAKAYNSKYNRTHFGTTFTLHMKTDFGNKLQMVVQGYKFSSNEYRLFPIVFELNLCDNINKNIFGVQNIYNRGNFTRCPMKKGNYIIPTWAPDHSQLPPYIPRGSYMMDINVTYNRAAVMRFQVYGAIKDAN